MKPPRILLSAAMIFVIASPGVCGDWNKRLAADYLDSRQGEWFGWARAAAPGGPCVSCHTGVTYLLARPLLRRELGEKEATSYEAGLLAGLRSRLDGGESMFRPSSDELKMRQNEAVEAVICALSLTLAEPPGPSLGQDTRRALERMWSLQNRDGANEGAWPWFDLDRDPWETGEATFYGATLAAVAAGRTPASYRDDAEVHARITALTGYFGREQAKQPLHNRLSLVWAATKLPELLPDTLRRQIVDEVWRKQGADGGWSSESLGPWKKRKFAPPSEGSSSYATALAAFVMRQAGIPRSDARLLRAIEWLRSHQDSETGSWPAVSMNTKYAPGSIPLLFMRDAATAFATVALLDSEGR